MKSKKIISLLLAIFIILTSFPVAASAVTKSETEPIRCEDFYAQSKNNYVTENGFVFDLDTQTIVQYDKTIRNSTVIDAAVNGCDDLQEFMNEFINIKTLVIPEKIAGKTVRFIGNRAFMNAEIEEVEIPECVEKIGDYAFANTQLKKVVLHEGLKEIGNGAFNLSEGCTLVVPSTVNYFDFVQYERSFTPQYDLILKNPNTKTGNFPKERITYDTNAEFPTLTYQSVTPEESRTYWCEHTENDGFTYAYPIDVHQYCKDCGCPFYSFGFGSSYTIRYSCDKCGSLQVTENREVSSSEYMEIYKAKFGMNMRQYAISRAIEKGLIADEYTPLADEKAISDCIKESSFDVFYWENGKIVCEYAPYIIAYSSEHDTTPEDIELPSELFRLIDAHIFDNNEKAVSLTVEIETLSSLVYEHGNSDFLLPSDISIFDTLIFDGIKAVLSYSDIRLFNNCNNLKILNLKDTTDYSSLNAASQKVEKAYNSDSLTLYLNKIFENNFTEYNLPEEYDYLNGAIYRENMTQLVAVVNDMEEYILPSTVTDVNCFAFAERKINSIKWNDTCKYVPSGCFAGVTAMSIDLKSVEKIEDAVFYLTDISTVQLPSTLKEIGILAFARSTIESIALPESLKSIAYGAFGRCLNLKTIEINCNIDKLKCPENELLFGSYDRLVTYNIHNPHITTMCNLEELLRDNAIFECCPNVSSISLGKNVSEVNDSVLGYLPSLITISVSEENNSYMSVDNFLINTGRQNNGRPIADLSPNGANYHDISDMNLSLFDTYFKPINSAIVDLGIGVSPYSTVNTLDINHMYLSSPDLSSPVNVSADVINSIINTPNFLHCKKSFDLSKSNYDKIELLDTVQLVTDENKSLIIKAEDNAEFDVALENVTGKIYKIPCWETLSDDDYYTVYDSVCYLRTNKEYISIPSSVCKSSIIYALSNTRIKAIRFEGNVDLTEYSPIYISTISSLYDVEFTPKTVKSVVPSSVVDQYVWDDGYLHFANLTDIVLQVSDINAVTADYVNRCINELWLPWVNTLTGQSYTASDGVSHIKFADKNGIEIDCDKLAEISDDLMFDAFIQELYNVAKNYNPELLEKNNVNSIKDFKKYYTENLIIFDAETQTIEGMISVDGRTLSSIVFPSEINGIKVKNISPLVAYLNSLESVYIPHTVEHLGYVSKNASENFKKTYQMMYKLETGIFSDEELDNILKEELGFSFSECEFILNGSLTDCWGLFCDASRITISPYNPYFKQKVNAIGGIEICSTDEKTCYLTAYDSYHVWLSQSEIYAPSSLTTISNGYYYYLTSTQPVTFNTGDFNIQIKHNEDTLLSEIYRLGADWAEITKDYGDGETNTQKTCNPLIYLSRESLAEQHCNAEHDEHCCQYKDPTTLDRYDSEHYQSLSQVNPPKSEIETTHILNTGTKQEYSEGEYHEKQIFFIKDELPERYRAIDKLVVVEPFQDLKEINLELKKGSVNVTILNTDTLSQYTGSAKFNVYNQEDNSLVKTFSMTDGIASCELSVGKYDVVPEQIEGFEFATESLPLSISEDGQTVDLTFEIYWTPEYTISIPEYIQATNDKETNIPYQITASDVRLSERNSLNVIVEYAGQLKNREDENVSLEYNLYSNDGIINSNDSILFIPKSTDFAKREFYAKLASKPNYAGVYTDLVTFNVSAVERVYTIEEIENDEHLFAIGKTDPSYVVARFNEDYTSVTIFKNGSQSDGLMMNWVGTNYNTSPMYKKRGTLKNVIVNEGTKSLGNYAFYNCSNITSVELPNGLTSIGNGTFYNCKKLSNISQLPKTLTDIGSKAFYSCSSLTEIAIPEGITVIKDNTFRECKKLTGVSLPSSLKEISWAAFWDCNLSEVDFPSGLLTIDDYAFADNNNLLVKAFPEGLKLIGYAAFKNCYPNSSYFVPASVEYIGTQAFYQAWNGGKNKINYIKVDENNAFYKDIDGVLFTKDGTVLMDYPSKKEDTSYVVPDGVLVIDDYALAYCHNITNITLPNGLREIKENAFYDCFVNELILPNTVKRIEKYAFYACDALTNIVLSNTLEEIGCEVFFGTAIQEITIPASVITLDNYALNGMQYLKEIIVDSDNEVYASVDGVLFSKDLTVLMQYPSNKDDTEYSIPNGTLKVNLPAFWHNSASVKFGTHLKVLNVPDSVTALPQFSGNNSYMRFYCLEAINLSEGNTKYSSIDGVLFDKEKIKLIYYPCGKKGTTYTIPETVNTVGKYSFMDNYTLTEVIIPNNVTVLNTSSFYKCSSLTNVIIDDGLTSIDGMIFYDCYNLASVTIPKSVTSIGESAFYGCSVTTIYGYSGSYAETWAKAYGWTFVPLNT